jgi:hypothetical protein
MAIVESGPMPAIHEVVRWRLVDLCRWVLEEFRVVISMQTMSRELRAMNYRKLSARPRHHAQATGAIEEFKKSGRPYWVKAFYDRLRAAGEPRRVALVACMHKLLTILNAIVGTKTKWEITCSRSTLGTEQDWKWSSGELDRLLWNGHDLRRYLANNIASLRLGWPEWYVS